jgi:hypothetical protein
MISTIGNWFMAFTNLYALLPIMAFWNDGQVLMAILLCAAMVASFAYHLAESEKHGMTGCRFCWTHNMKQRHHVLINVDRALSIGGILVFVISRPEHLLLPETMVKAAALLVLLFFSEHPTVFVGNDDRLGARMAYMVLHSGWHIGVFHLAWTLVGK